jgi:hypothetical protein
MGAGWVHSHTLAEGYSRAARAKISSLVIKAALAAALADSVAVATAAIELVAIGLIVSSEISSSTWFSYGHRLDAHGYRVYCIGSGASASIGSQGLKTMRVASSKGSPEKEVRRSRRVGDELQEGRRSRRVGEPDKEARRSRRIGEPDKEARRCIGDESEGRRSRGVGDELEARRSRGVGDESETCAVKCGEVSAWWGTKAPL